MKKNINNLKKLYKHKTKRNVLLRFSYVLLVFIFYFIFVSYKFGFSNGFIVTIMSWSFFLFCTPIADAGFLIDFPVRLISRIRMIYVESSLWVFGISFNLFMYFFKPAYYQKTFLLKIFWTILSNPFPYYGIIILSFLGTFLSIYFGDELLDVARHKERRKFKKHKLKHRFIIFTFIILLIFLFYYSVLNKLGISF